MPVLEPAALKQPSAPDASNTWVEQYTIWGKYWPIADSRSGAPVDALIDWLNDCSGGVWIWR